MTQIPTPNISLYFLYMVDLTFIMRKAIETLYAPKAARRTWSEMEMVITTLANDADNWRCRLPREFNFGELDSKRPFARQCASLCFHFYSTKLVILQPYLRQLAYQPPGTGAPGTNCDKIAAMCVQDARTMLDILPDEADATWLFETALWWCILHYMMQSTSILLTELFTQTQLGPSNAVSLSQSVQKAIRWLHEMSAKDLSARRAWLICVDILSRHDSSIALGVGVGG